LEGRPPDRWGRGEITIADLFKSSLRLRPDRIIIGEVRGGEALDMIQAMTSGHAGSMSTLHANMPMDALNRLETLAMMNPIELPLHALRSQIASAIDVIVQMTRFNDGRRKITQVSEVMPLGDNGHYQLRDIFAFGHDDRGRVVDTLVWTGERSLFADEAKIRIQDGSWRAVGEIFREDT